MINFIANNVWRCHLNSVSRVFEAKHESGEEISCHLSQPEARLLERMLNTAEKPVSRKDLSDFAWGGRAVAPGSLNHAIFNLRNAFGPKEGHKVILTVPKIGYKIRAKLLGDLPNAQPRPLLDQDAHCLDELPAAAPVSSAPEPARGRRWTTKQRFCALTLAVVVNLGLALATYQWIQYRLDTRIPALDYAPVGESATTHFFAQRALANDSHLRQAISALLANPASLQPSRPFVYINEASGNGHYSYFLCERSITSGDGRCGAFVIESGGNES